MTAIRMLLFALASLTLATCAPQSGWHARDISGALPALNFDMRRASDGKAVTGEDYRGQVVLLYFGYTNCPDVCPATLANLAAVLERLGGKASGVKVLFLTVDPQRDRLPALRAYVQAFGTGFDGLLGDRNEIARVARRYRVAYSVTPPEDGKPETVSHSAAVFIFDRTGRARLVSLTTDDIAGLTADLTRLLSAPAS